MMMLAVLTSRLASVGFLVLLVGLIAGAALLWVARDADPVQSQAFQTFDQAASKIQRDIQSDLGHDICGELVTHNNGGVRVDHDLGPSDAVPAGVRDLVTDYGLAMDDFARSSQDHRLLVTRTSALRLSTATTDRQLLGAVIEFGLFDTGSGPKWHTSEFAIFYECDVTDSP